MKIYFKKILFLVSAIFLFSGNVVGQYSIQIFDSLYNNYIDSTMYGLGDTLYGISPKESPEKMRILRSYIDSVVKYDKGNQALSVRASFLNHQHAIDPQRGVVDLQAELKKANSLIDSAILIKRIAALKVKYDFGGGLRDFNTSLILYPLKETFYERSNAQFNYGSIHDAITDLDTAIFISETFSDIHLYAFRAQCKVLIGDTVGALQDFKIAALNTPSASYYHQQIVFLQNKLGLKDCFYMAKASTGCGMKKLRDEYQKLCPYINFEKFAYQECIEYRRKLSDEERSFFKVDCNCKPIK